MNSTFSLKIYSYFNVIFFIFAAWKLCLKGKGTTTGSASDSKFRIRYIGYVEKQHLS